MSEVLKNLLGDLYTPEIEKKVGSNEIAIVNNGSYIPRAKYTEEVKALKEQLTSRDKQLKDLEGKATGNEDLKKELQRLQDENKTKAEAYEKQIQQIQFDTALDRALSGKKAKNPKAVKALLNLESIKIDGEKLLGLDEQLANLQKSDSYLFGESAPVGNSTNPPGSSGTPGSTSVSMNQFIREASGKA